MSADADVSAHVGPWTEAEYEALPETANRIELVDGALVVSPIANRPHQRLALHLAIALGAVAPSDLEVLGELNVRLGTDRILIPDLVIADNPGGTETFVDASHVVLVAEITSPSNAGIDRLLQAAALCGRWHPALPPRRPGDGGRRPARCGGLPAAWRAVCGAQPFGPWRDLDPGRAFPG